MINKCKLWLTAYTSLQGVLGGLINEGAYIRGGPFNRNRNSASKKAIAELIKVLYRCAINLQTIIIKQLHVNKIWNRMRGGHILGGGGGGEAYNLMNFFVYMWTGL